MLHWDAASPHSTVADDMTTTANIGPSYGLQLSTSKREAISNTGVVSHPVLAGFDQKTTDTATLLGAPISTGSAMTACLAARCAATYMQFNLTRGMVPMAAKRSFPTIALYR